MSTTTPLTDSINALTTYANSVTGESDTTLSDAVYTLASGYGVSEFNPMQFINTINNMFLNAVFDGDVTLDFTGNPRTTGGSAYQWFMGSSGADNIEVIGLTKTSGFEFFRSFFGSAFKTITFTDCSFVSTNWREAFANNTYLQSIYGALDFTGATNTTYVFNNNSALVDVEFKSDSVPISISLSSSSLLSDASLVSIANGLDSTASSQTLTLHATPLARCSTLMGTVTDGTFTADESGTVTLADFITNTKGWTLTS